MPRRFLSSGQPWPKSRSGPLLRIGRWLAAATGLRPSPTRQRQDLTATPAIPPRHVLRVRGWRRQQVGAGALRLCLSLDHPGRHARQCTPSGDAVTPGLGPAAIGSLTAGSVPIARAMVGELGTRRRMPLADLKKRRAVRTSPDIWAVGTHALSWRGSCPLRGRPPLRSSDRRQSPMRLRGGAEAS